MSSYFSWFWGAEGESVNVSENEEFYRIKYIVLPASMCKFEKAALIAMLNDTLHHFVCVTNDEDARMVVESVDENMAKVFLFMHKCAKELKCLQNMSVFTTYLASTLALKHGVHCHVLPSEIISFDESQLNHRFDECKPSVNV